MNLPVFLIEDVCLYEIAVMDDGIVKTELTRVIVVSIFLICKNYWLIVLDDTYIQYFHLQIDYHIYVSLFEQMEFISYRRQSQ